jgi:hypothetical protein
MPGGLSPCTCLVASSMHQPVHHAPPETALLRPICVSSPALVTRTAAGHACHACHATLLSLQFVHASRLVYKNDTGSKHSNRRHLLIHPPPRPYHERNNEQQHHRRTAVSRAKTVRCQAVRCPDCAVLGEKRKSTSGRALCRLCCSSRSSRGRALPRGRRCNHGARAEIRRTRPCHHGATVQSTWHVMTVRDTYKRRGTCTENARGTHVPCTRHARGVPGH